MSRRRDTVALMISGCLAVVAVVATVAPALAASSSSTATAPQQLVHQYPLGPQRLCCQGQAGLSGTSGSTTANPSAPPAHVPPATGRARTSARSIGAGAAGAVSAELVAGLGALVVILLSATGAVYLTRRRKMLVLRHGVPGPAPPANSQAVAPAVSKRSSFDRSPVPAVSEDDERAFHRLDAEGDAGGAFNLGVMLHQRGDLEAARAAYERAEERGDPDAGFNLGVLLYEAGDLDGAETAWRRSAGRGHVRAAANLLFLSRRRRELALGDAIPSEATGLAEFEELSYRRADESGAASGAFNLGAMLHQQGDTAGALAAYERAERRGDPDAAFNLGVLLYESGDLDGAESAWRRGARRGHARAAENLDFLVRHRHELEAAVVGGGTGPDT